jgi:3-mercaptopyruvate sulfurtransferase SseA
MACRKSGDKLEIATTLIILSFESGNRERGMVDVVTRDEVKAGLADGSIALVDVREPHEFAAGHIPGATLLPL